MFSHYGETWAQTAERMGLTEDELTELAFGGGGLPPTIVDSEFNDTLRSVYSEAGRALVEGSDVVDIIAKKLKLKYAKPDEGGGGRF